VNPSPYAPPRLIFWESTAGCNLACIHCRRITVADQLLPQDLTTAEATGLIDQVAAFAKPIFVLSGGEPGPHIIQGIGAGFIPANMDPSLMDGVVKVSNDASIAHARRLARTEGIPVGISSGAAFTAGLEIAKRPDMTGKTIVTIMPSFAERYVSTLLFEGLGRALFT